MRLSKILIPITAVLLAGCSAVAALQPTPTSTATPEPPTPTPVPAAAIVNGEIIPLSDYNASLQQLKAAQQEAGTTATPEEQQQMVLDDLIAQTLLAQAAVQAGHRWMMPRCKSASISSPPPSAGRKNLPIGSLIMAMTTIPFTHR